MKKKILAFNYFGAKFNHLDWLLSLLPDSYSFVEPFSGSAVVLLNRKASRIETINDINSDVVNFFNVLREDPVNLCEKIYFTPYSREEYYHCLNTADEGDDIERARKFFVCVNQGFASVGKARKNTGWGYTAVVSNSIVSECVSRWLSKLPKLKYVIDRLKKVQLNNIDFRELFPKFDSPGTLFYCDPPYLHTTRTGKTDYLFEMNETDHLDLLAIIRNAKGKVAISGYENEMYKEELTNFYLSRAKETRRSLRHSVRKECLWTNYDPKNVKHQHQLFD